MTHGTLPRGADGSALPGCRDCEAAEALAAVRPFAIVAHDGRALAGAPLQGLAPAPGPGGAP